MSEQLNPAARLAHNNWLESQRERLRIRKTKNDDIDAAMELVMDLAFQNIVDRFDNPSEYRRQMAAYKLVKSTFSKSGD